MLRIALTSILAVLGLLFMGPALAASAADSAHWVSPVGSAPVPDPVAGFAPPPERWLAGHRGVDLAALPGEEVRSAGAGTVSFVGMLAGRGVVTVVHGGLRTTYEPVDAIVVTGESVRRGQVIGRLAAGGHCSLRCLHWGLRRGDEYLDPMLLLEMRPPVLKTLKQRRSAQQGPSTRTGSGAAGPVDPAPRTGPPKTAPPHDVRSQPLDTAGPVEPEQASASASGRVAALGGLAALGLAGGTAMAVRSLRTRGKGR